MRIPPTPPPSMPSPEASGSMQNAIENEIVKLNQDLGQHGGRLSSAQWTKIESELEVLILEAKNPKTRKYLEKALKDVKEAAKYAKKAEEHPNKKGKYLDKEDMAIREMFNDLSTAKMYA